MILKSRQGRELAKHLARPIVAQLAPEEVEDFDELAEDFFDDPRLQNDHTLGSGLDLLPDLVVILMFVSATLERLLTGSKEGSPKSLLERLSKKLIHDQEVNQAPWFSPEEWSSALESAGRKSRRLPERTRKKIAAMLGKLLPIRVGMLCLGASPEPMPRVAVGREFAQIAAVLREAPLRERIALSQAFATTSDELHRALLAQRPQILHFSGHGTEEKDLVIEDPTGGATSMPGESVLQLINIFKDDLRLVVFNACHTETQASAAAALVDAVVGMNGPIGDTTAMSFSRAFYRALFHGSDLRRAFDLGCSQISLDESSGEAAIPCLFVLRDSPSDIVLVEALRSEPLPKQAAPR